jgi:hypothetical protein
MRTPFYFDAETVPVQDPALVASLRADLDASLQVDLAALRAPANYKDADKIAEYVAKARADLTSAHAAKAEEALLKTSFDGGVGQCVCIAFAVGDGEPRVYAVEDLSRDAERTMLECFFTTLEEAGFVTLVGHNIIGFDIPFLWKRAMVLGVKPPFNFPRNPKPWSELIEDTMLLWDGQQRAGGSMDRICRLLGIPGKDGMSGADVWPAVQEGRLLDVAAYCKGDVIRTRAMHRRMTFAEAAPIRAAAPAPAVAPAALPENIFA